MVSSPRVNVASPRMICNSAGFEAVCSVRLLALVEAEDHGFELIVVVEGPAQDSMSRRLGLRGQIGNVSVWGAHLVSFQ